MEVSEFIESFQKDWNEFKKANNTILEKKANGESVADLEEKLDKISASLDNAEEAQQRLARIETALKRVGSFESKGSANLTDEQLEHKAAFASWFRKGQNGFDETQLKKLETKALSVNDDTQGGFMVHADLSGRIIKKIFETSPIRQYAAVTSISTDALEGPMDLDEGTATWVAETGTRGQTANPKIGMWRIPTHEMFAQPACTQKLLDDAAWDPEMWLSEKIADKFARTENAAFVNGDGVGKPKGYLAEDTIADAGAADTFTASRKIGYIPTGVADNFPLAPSAAADGAVGDPLIAALYSLKTNYREAAGTAWAMHRSVFGRVRRIRDNFGNYIWQPGLQAGQPSSLLGYPIAEFNDMPVLGASNKFAIAIANWRAAYQIVDRIGIRVLRDPYTAKPFILFYTTKRTGGALLNFEAIKLVKFATS